MDWCGDSSLDAEMWLPAPGRVVPAAALQQGQRDRLWGGSSSCSVLLPQPVLHFSCPCWIYGWALFRSFKNFQSPHETNSWLSWEKPTVSIDLEEMTLLVFMVLGNLRSLSVAFFQFHLGTEGVSPDVWALPCSCDSTEDNCCVRDLSPHNFKPQIFPLFSQYGAVLGLSNYFNNIWLTGIHHAHLVYF